MIDDEAIEALHRLIPQDVRVVEPEDYEAVIAPVDNPVMDAAIEVLAGRIQDWRAIATNAMMDARLREQASICAAETYDCIVTLRKVWGL